MYVEYVNTPIGFIAILASHLGITKVTFISEPDIRITNGNEITRSGQQQLQEYFENQRKDFDLPLDLQGTDFQRSVWSCLLTIPFGETRSYRDISLIIDNPKSARAVGAANGKNPIGIIVPCHRVIGSNRTLTGYAGGLDRKAWLLQHEGIDFKEQEKKPNHSTEFLQTTLFDVSTALENG